MSEVTAATAEVAAAEEQPWTLGRQLVDVSRHVANLPRGPRAILRRLRQHPNDVPPDEFWTIVDRYAIRPADEPFWITILPLMVKHPHQVSVKPGDALARFHVKDARVERWLRLDIEHARSEAHRLLARVDGGFDWARFGQLLYHWSDEGRRALARDFFLSSHHER